jgi:hypothetical protein
MIVLIAGTWEVVVQTRGLAGTAVDDTPELWIRERERAASLGDDAVILVGASRMQMGMDLRTMQAHTRRTPVQLAVSASPFMPILAHLAADDRITGTVIVSFTMQDFLSVTTASVADRWVADYEDYRANRTRVLYQRLEDALRNAAAAALLSLGKGARPQQIVFGDRAGYLRTLPDRSQQADYRSVDREAAYRRRVALYLSGEQPRLREIPDLDRRLEVLETMIGRIRGRGGEVILVRFPSTRRIWQIDEIQYPKEVYWDELARRTNARTIHFAEHPTLSAFELPDGVHLDYRDTPKFTAALARLIF